MIDQRARVAQLEIGDRIPCLCIAQTGIPCTLLRAYIELMYTFFVIKNSAYRSWIR
jgi:hypothetical protein